MKILVELFGAGILQEFGKSNGHDLLLLTRDFERKKKTFKISSEELNSVKLSIPYSLIEIVEAKKKKTFAEVIATSKYNEQLRFKRNTSTKQFHKNFHELPIDTLSSPWTTTNLVDYF
jgi:hypothetical protein